MASAFDRSISGQLGSALNAGVRQGGAHSEEGVLPQVVWFPSSQVGWENTFLALGKRNELVILDVMNWFLCMCGSCHYEV